jgi:hypothetical protein
MVKSELFGTGCTAGQGSLEWSRLDRGVAQLLLMVVIFASALHDGKTAFGANSMAVADVQKLTLESHIKAAKAPQGSSSGVRQSRECLP